MANVATPPEDERAKSQQTAMRPSAVDYRAHVVYDCGIIVSPQQKPKYTPWAHSFLISHFTAEKQQERTQFHREALMKPGDLNRGAGRNAVRDPFMGWPQYGEIGEVRIMPLCNATCFDGVEMPEHQENEYIDPDDLMKPSGSIAARRDPRADGAAEFLATRSRKRAYPPDLVNDTTETNAKRMALSETRSSGQRRRRQRTGIPKAPMVPEPERSVNDQSQNNLAVPGAPRLRALSLPRDQWRYHDPSTSFDSTGRYLPRQEHGR